MSEEWAEADEVSDRVVEMLNERRRKVRAEQLLVGLLLGLIGFLKTAPPPWPESLKELERAAAVVVEELRAVHALRR
jgi:hypothetical protein